MSWVLKMYDSNMHGERIKKDGMKLFNSHSQSIKNLSVNPKQFKSALNNYLYAQSLYSVDKYYNVNREW